MDYLTVDDLWEIRSIAQIYVRNGWDKEDAVKEATKQVMKQKKRRKLLD